MAPPGRHAPQLPADHLRLAVGGPRRDPAAERAAPRDPWGRLLRARPVLSLWVHATLIDSTIVGNDAWLGPLSRERAARFYEETLPIARAFGVTDRLLPPTLDAFDAYMAERLAPGGGVHVTDTARELADTILNPPLPGLLARLPLDPRAYGWTLWPAVGLLAAEPSARATGCAGDGANASSRTGSWRAGGRGTRCYRPSFRQMPQALAADRRVGQ